MLGKCMYLKSKQSAFSLVELSIVLVILGLLAGGALSGQALINAAALRKVSSDYQLFVTSTQSFRDKYFGLPGDMPNATAFWGSAGGASHKNDKTCRTTDSTGSKATCDGNGDGIIDYYTDDTAETHRFWQQLANAGLIAGSYSGIAQPDTGAAPWHTGKTNAPTSKFHDGLWFVSNMFNEPLSPPDYRSFVGIYGNNLVYGGASAQYGPSTSIFIPEELWNIDVKLDDGKPGTGKMVLYSSSGVTACTNAVDNTDINASYSLSQTSRACVPIFRNAF